MASKSFRLLQNYPNPFNGTTTIAFRVAEPASNVKIDIVNLRGQTLFSQRWNSLAAGLNAMTWSGTDSNGQSVASGVYFYRLKADGFESVSKMLLLK
jgi:flagellar hook assembly protein FlgD